MLDDNRKQFEPSDWEIKEPGVFTVTQPGWVSTLVSNYRPPPKSDPVALYLTSLHSKAFRRTQAHALKVLGNWLSREDDHGYPLYVVWESIRAEHTTYLRFVLKNRYRPTTRDKYLSAVRGVLKQSLRLGQMTAEEYQSAIDGSYSDEYPWTRSRS